MVLYCNQTHITERLVKYFLFVHLPYETTKSK